MPSKHKRAVQVLLVLALVLAGLGQYDLGRQRALLTDGLVFYLLGVFCLAWVITLVEEPAPAAHEGGWSLWRALWQLLRGSGLRLAVALGGLLLELYVAVATRARLPEKLSYDLLFWWGVGIGLAVGAFVDWAGLPQRLRRLWPTARRYGPEITLVVLLVLATFLLRAVTLDRFPHVLSGDEASMGLEALDVLRGHRASAFVTGWLSHPTLYFFMQAAFLRVLGISVAALRLPSALISAATVVLLYLLARRFYGRWVALLAAILFATWHYAIHFGRLALNNIWDPFFALGVFYFVNRGLKEKRLGSILAAGVLAGLAFYFYMGARLIPLILAIYLLYWAWRERGFWRENLPYLIVLGFLALVVALPLLSAFLANPDEAMARWNQMGIFPSGWLKGEMARTGHSMFSVLWAQFLKAALAFNYYPDPTTWYNPQIPLLQFIPSIFFVLGLTYAIVQIRQREYLLLVAWWLMVIIFGGVLLENPPTSPRLVLAIPPAVVLVALGVSRVTSYLQAAFARSRQVAWALALVLVVLISWQSVSFYFGEYSRERRFSDLNTLVGNVVGKYLNTLGPSYQCYFFGAPRMYYGFATIPFFARDVAGTDVMSPLGGPPDFVNPQRKAVFVFLPERRAELEVVRRYYPTGLLREFRDPKYQLLFIAYEKTD